MNYLGSYWLVWIVLVLITLIGILIAYGLYRLFYLGRKYPGITIVEDIFTLLFTLPCAIGAGYVVFIFPIGFAVLLTAGSYLWLGEWPYDKPFFSMYEIPTPTDWPRTAEQWFNSILLLSTWIAPVLTISLIRRRNLRLRKNRENTHEKEK